MDVDFVWQRDCPNVTAARRNLMKAFSLAGIPAHWREWCLDDAGCPESAQMVGSPSILIEGEDIAGVPAGGGQSCRLYRTVEGTLMGVPPAELIASRLRSAKDL